MPDMTRRSCRPRNILFVQRTGGGGSLINVLLLVKHLDHEQFRPIVLFYGPNPYTDDFRAAGAEVRVLDSTAPARSVSKVIPEGSRPEAGDRRSFRAVRQLNGFVQRDWGLARHIVEVIEDVGADLVQSNICPSADRASIVAAGLARVRQVSYSQFFTADTAWLDRPLSTLVDRYLCISESVRQQVRRAAGAPEGKTRVVHAPFEFPTCPTTPTAAGVRRSLGVNGRHQLIANVGRIVPWKGQDVFLRAFASVAADHPDARAVVVGSAGDKLAGQAFEVELRRLVTELHLGERVIFTGHRNDVQDIMSASDVVVHSSSQAEPLGRVIMEAIALEKPVIATGAGGVPEMVCDGETGLLVPPGDADAMASALGSILRKPERAAEMAVRARRAAERRFSAQTFVRTVESEYRRILGL
jgi:glycosyltransferase involved in cell wall biosynthesis